MFIKCNQHYQIYKLKSHQRRTTIHKLTLQIHLLARFATSFFFFSIHACDLASASACVFIQNLPGQRGIAVHLD